MIAGRRSGPVRRRLSTCLFLGLAASDYFQSEPWSQPNDSDIAARIRCATPQRVPTGSVTPHKELTFHVTSTLQNGRGRGGRALGQRRTSCKRDKRSLQRKVGRPVSIPWRSFADKTVGLTSLLTARASAPCSRASWALHLVRSAFPMTKSLHLDRPKSLGFAFKVRTLIAVM